MTERIEEVEFTQEPDRFATLRVIRDQVAAFHAQGIELHKKLFSTAEEAQAATETLYQEFVDSYSVEAAVACGADVRVSGEGVLTPNITMEQIEDEEENETILQFTRDNEQPLEPLEPFDTKVGIIVGAMSNSEETDEGFRPDLSLIIELHHRIAVNISDPKTGLPMLSGYLPIKMLARMTEDTTIEFPKLDEADRYVKSIGSFALNSEGRQEFIENVNKLRGEFETEIDDDFKDLEEVQRIHQIAKSSEAFIKQKQSTQEEVEELLTTLFQTGRFLQLKGRVTGGLNRQSEVVERSGKLIQIFMQSDEQDNPLAVIAVEARNDEGHTATECFVMKELEVLRY